MSISRKSWNKILEWITTYFGKVSNWAWHQRWNRKYRMHKDYDNKKDNV